MTITIGSADSARGFLGAVITAVAWGMGLTIGHGLISWVLSVLSTAVGRA